VAALFLAKQACKCHPALRPGTCAEALKRTFAKSILGQFLQKSSTCMAECIQKAFFAHVHKKPSCQNFGLHVQHVWSTCAARYPPSSRIPRRLHVARVQDYQLSSQVPQDCTLQVCQAKAWRTASGNLLHPQIFTRLDKWSCRHMLAVAKALDCAIMSST